MKNSALYFESLYAFSLIPVFYYEHQNLTFAFPENGSPFHPPEKYLQRFFDSFDRISYIMTDFYGFYGCIKENENDSMLIFGPVSSIPFSKKILSSIQKEYFVSEVEFECFADFFDNISCQSLENFLRFLSFVHYGLYDFADSPIELTTHNAFVPESVSQKYALQQYTAKEDETFNNSLSIENKLISFVETGNLDGLQNFFAQSHPLSVGVIANDNLRQIKNATIIMIALICRASIRSGLTPEIAFHLSDAYIQQLESLSAIYAVQQLSSKALIDYTTRVAENSFSVSEDKVIHEAIQFVQQNTNRSITVGDVAKHVGFSRCYLSHRFKSTLNFDLGSFIRRCKLEEAKELLKYTEKSISEISAYLCFSSQAHFQTAFKKQYQKTPQKYRNERR